MESILEVVEEGIVESESKDDNRAVSEVDSDIAGKYCGSQNGQQDHNENGKPEN